MYEEGYEEGKSEKINSKLIYAFIIFIITIVFIVVIINIRKPKEFCGNHICEYGENINNCCVDCGCPKGYECKNNTCVNSSPIVNSTCGDGICSTNENCYNCPKDCKCFKGQYCSEEEKKCVYPKCGNGICEPFESFENCCDDCPCGVSWFVCNTTSHKCEPPHINITKNEVINIIRKHYENVTVESINDIHISSFNNSLGMQARVKINGLDRYVFVSEKRKFVELLTV